MAAFLQAKRVGDPLGGRLRDRLVGGDQWRRSPSCGSSGSEHSSDACLSEMVLDFFEDGCRSASPPEESSDAVVLDVVVVAADCTVAVGEICSIMTAGNGNVGTYRELILAHALEAAEMASEFQTDGVVSRRRFMTVLRGLDHNAAICKTKWGSSRGVTAGDYEFIDVVKGNVRYLIDANFPEQFEIARPTVQYSELVESLPKVFVGTPEELKKIVKIMCDAAKRSLSQMELSVPPWRKNSYMQKKWLGPYRRTVNPVPNKPSVPEYSPGWSVKCRWVGFDAVVSDVEVNGRAFVCTRPIKAV